MLIATLRSALLAPSYRVIRGWLALVMVLGGLSMPCWAQCPPGTVVLRNQADVNQFPPGCSNLPGDLRIEDGDITDLSPLSNLETIGGALRILGNNYLVSLTGLENLTAIGGSLTIVQHYKLSDISALSQLTRISGTLEVFYNVRLDNLKGLDNITSIGADLKILDNTSLGSLTDLSKLMSVGGGIEIRRNDIDYLWGLENLTAIPGGLTIIGNNDLRDLRALDNLTRIGGGLTIAENVNLEDLTGLDNLTRIGGGLAINSNDDLVNISALSQLDSIGGDLEITGNLQLSQCAILAICQYLAFSRSSARISNNATGCNSAQQIEGQCSPIPIQITHQSPASVGRCAGDTVSLSVIATGTDPQYQWYKDGAAITDVSSATTATLLLTDLQPTSNGHYTVQITNTISAQTSDPVSLTVYALPDLTLTSNGPISASQPTVTLTATDIAGAAYAFSSGTTPGNTPNTATVSTPGSYSVTVTTPTGCTASAQTTVEAQAGSVTGFELINANTDQVIKTLSEGEVLNLAQLPTSRLTIRANTTPTMVGSVVFALSGSMTYAKTETSAPYSLFGDDNGNYDPWNLKVGSYSLRATPYLGAGGTGLMGTPMTLNFSIINQAPPANQPPIARAGADQTITLPTNSVTLNGSTSSDPEGGALTYQWTQRSGPNTANLSSATSASLTAGKLAAGTYVFRLTVRDTPGATGFDEVTVRVNPAPSAGPVVVSFSLMNADTDQPIRVITNNEVLNLAQLPRNLNIRANTNPATVGSVKMVLSGPQKRTQTETGAPYALFGDNNGAYNNWTPTVGNYTLTGTAYSGGNASGQAGTPLSISFRVVNQGANARLSAEADLQVVLLGNPMTGDEVTFEVRGAGEQPLQIQLLDTKGLLITERQLAHAGSQAQRLSVAGQPAGLFLLRVSTPQQSRTVKVIKRN